MATYDATQSAGSTHPKGSASNTDPRPFEAYDRRSPRLTSASTGRTVRDRGPER